MKNIFYLFLSVLISIVFSSCSSSEETTQKETPAEDSVYVFDEVPADSIIVKQAEEPTVFPPVEAEKYYLVQIGAFTTKEKAEEFAEMSRKKLNSDVVVIYSNQVNLFVVQLTTLFPLREGAEKVRNNLWEMKDFKDAWILTVTK